MGRGGGKRAAVGGDGGSKRVGSELWLKEGMTPRTGVNRCTMLPVSHSHGRTLARPLARSDTRTQTVYTRKKPPEHT